MQILKNIDIRNILNIPFLYLAYRNFAGGKRTSSIFVNEYIRPVRKDKIIDIGCGPGDIIEHFHDVDYTGFDSNQEYIDSAIKNYGDRGRFFCGMVDTVETNDVDNFDIAVASGILHHIDDKEAIALFNLAKKKLRKGGRLVTLDCCFENNQSIFARFIISNDRGKFVRTSHGFAKLASTVFSDVKVSLRHDLLRFPYTHIIMECKK